MFYKFAFVISLALVLFSFSCTNQTSTKTEVAKIKGEVLQIGDTLVISNLEITVDTAYFADTLHTGNSVTDEIAGKGNQYLVLQVVMRNIDRKSKILEEGSLLMENTNETIHLDESEIVLAEGWGFFFERLNPSCTHTSNLAYKVPKKGSFKIYWIPGGSFGSTRFHLK